MAVTPSDDGTGGGTGSGTDDLILSYRYSAGGQRYWTDDCAGQASATASCEATYYVLDGAETVGVFTASGALTYWNAGGVGRHLADGSRRYYLTDHLGSVRTVVDGTGALVEAKDYYPYGLELPGRTVQASPPTKEGFTGHEQDGATGLVYAGARYYMPAVPRWTSVDPLAYLYPGHSPYNYVMGDPVSLVDPTGRCPEGVNHGDVFTDDTGTEVMCYNEGNPEGAVVEAEDQSDDYEVEHRGWSGFLLGDGEQRIGGRWHYVDNSWYYSYRHDSRRVVPATLHENPILSLAGPLGAYKSAKFFPSALKKILPSWKRIKINIEHISSGHMVGGSRVSPMKDLFPSRMTTEQVEKAVRNAYRNVYKKLSTQGERIKVRGVTDDGMEIEMWINTNDNIIETAYPVN